MVFHGEGFPSHEEVNIQKIIDNRGPFDYVFSWGYKYCNMYEPMTNLKIPLVVFMVDYLPRNLKVENAFLNKHRPDICILRSTYSFELFTKCQREGKIPLKTIPLIFPFSVDPHIYRPRNYSRLIDICASMSQNSRIYKNRPQVKEICHNFSPPYVVSTAKIYRHQYAEMLAASKIFVNSNGKRNCMTMKYFEAIASGCLLITDKPNDFEEWQFHEDKNCVLYSDLDELKNKLEYYLKHQEESRKIANNGRHMFSMYHTNYIRTGEILNAITKVCPI